MLKYLNGNKVFRAKIPTRCFETTNFDRLNREELAFVSR